MAIMSGWVVCFSRKSDMIIPQIIFMVQYKLLKEVALILVNLNNVFNFFLFESLS